MNQIQEILSTKEQFDRDYEECFGTPAQMAANKRQRAPDPTTIANEIPAIDIPAKEELPKLLNFRGQRLDEDIDIMSYNPSYLIDEYFIAVNTITRVIGDSFAGKTILMKDLAFRAVLGLQWFDRLPINLPKDKKVLFIELEGSVENHRAQNTRIKNGLISSAGLDRASALATIKERFIMEYQPNLSFDSEKQAERYALEIAAEIKKNNIGLLVIDNQTTLTNKSETSSNEDKIRWILDAFTKALNMNAEFPCYCILIHHFNKSGSSSGSHQLRAATINEFNLNYDETNETRFLTHTKSSMSLNRTPIYIAYENGGQDSPTIKGLTTELHVVENKLHADKLKATTAEAEKVAESKRKAVLELLKPAPLNKSKLAEAMSDEKVTVKSGDSKFKSLIASLIELGQIREIAGKGTEKLLEVVPDSWAEVKQGEAAE